MVVDMLLLCIKQLAGFVMLSISQIGFVYHLNGGSVGEVEVAGGGCSSLLRGAK